MNFIIGIFDYFRLVIHRSFYSKKMIRRYQTKQLKKIYKYAINNSVFYKELYNEKQFNNLEDFYKLPIINKSIMMANFTDLNTCGIIKEDVTSFAVEKENDKDYLGYYKDDYVIGLSSGTSGNKGIYITPKEMTKRLPSVFLARSGLSLKMLPYRILFVLRVFSQGFEDINSRVVSLHYCSTMERVEDIILKINSLKINILMAPPSLIRELLPYSDKIVPKIKKIICYAEVLEDVEKERFEKAFNTKVIEIYQASEGQIASACKYGHLHINEELVFVELYDEQNRIIDKDNIVGHKMIITNLINYAQPLIRYEMNDMIVLDNDCPCGSKYRRIKKVLGRHDDLLYFLDDLNTKKYIFPDLFVRWIIVCSDNIREFQVIQDKINHVNIFIDTIHSHDDSLYEIIKSKVINELKVYRINDPIINVKFKKITLPKEKNKYKRFITNIND